MLKFTKGQFARDPQEPHRTATPLELFFDLIFVVAIASAASGLHHYLADRNIADGLIWYMLAFFAIWWCWMNYTWYSSAYNTEDTVFILLTFVMIFGALVFSVGVANIFDSEHKLAVPVTGFIIMRIAMVALWLRAAYHDKQRRQVCIRYAVGITIMQIGWVLTLLLPLSWYIMVGFVLVLGELFVPYYAEKNYAENGTPWHPHHIAERYSLLVIIVLGEGILGAANTISSLINTDTRWQDAFPLGLGAAGLMFSLWWCYFSMPFPAILHQNKSSRFVSFLFGYGHWFVFVSLAAVGVGLQLIADAAESLTNTGRGVTPLYALICLQTAVAIYLNVLSFYRTVLIRKSTYHAITWVCTLLAPMLPVWAVYAGLQLEWSLLLSILAPIAFIVLNHFDDCAQQGATGFEVE